MHAFEFFTKLNHAVIVYFSAILINVHYAHAMTLTKHTPVTHIPLSHLFPRYQTRYLLSICLVLPSKIPHCHSLSISLSFLTPTHSLMVTLHNLTSPLAVSHSLDLPPPHSHSQLPVCCRRNLHELPWVSASNPVNHCQVFSNGFRTTVSINLSYKRHRRSFGGKSILPLTIFLTFSPCLIHSLTPPPCVSLNSRTNQTYTRYNTDKA